MIAERILHLFGKGEQPAACGCEGRGWRYRVLRLVMRLLRIPVCEPYFSLSGNASINLPGGGDSFIIGCRPKEKKQ